MLYYRSVNQCLVFQYLVKAALIKYLTRQVCYHKKKL